MGRYADVDVASWESELDRLRDRLTATPALEVAASTLVQELHGKFSESTALARVYAVIAYKDLEPDVRAFVDALAARMNEEQNVKQETPVLALLGTHGEKAEWCDRTKSLAHRGIPLISASFVQSIPMVARLLKELGVDLAWLDDAPELNARRLLGGFNGVFYVDDASRARDGQGRLIIPAQDFVTEHEIKTVFGMGGVYPNGTLLALIVFARESLRRSDVERLTSLISVFKGETFGAVRSHRFFA